MNTPESLPAKPEPKEYRDHLPKREVMRPEIVIACNTLKETIARIEKKMEYAKSMSSGKADLNKTFFDLHSGDWSTATIQERQESIRQFEHAISTLNKAFDSVWKNKTIPAETIGILEAEQHSIAQNLNKAFELSESAQNDLEKEMQQKIADGYRKQLDAITTTIDVLR